MSNSFLNRSAVRFVVLTVVILKLIYIFFSSLFFLINCKECTEDDKFLLQVYRLRLLGDYHHSTRIAFVEFVMVISC